MINICINRVKLRVEQGGHNVNPDVIKQRYTTGLALLKRYKDFPDVLILLDDSDGIAKTELELRKGVVHYQSAQFQEWVIPGKPYKFYILFLSMLRLFIKP